MKNTDADKEEKEGTASRETLTPQGELHTSRQTPRSSGSLKPVKAWAWAIHNTKGDYVFCFWAEPTKERLLRRKPSPEAKEIPVWISFRNTML